MIKGAIFDIDGTLLDSMPIWENVGARYLATLGIKAKPDLKERLELYLCQKEPSICKKSMAFRYQQKTF